MITVQQVWMVRAADPTAIRSRPVTQAQAVSPTPMAPAPMAPAPVRITPQPAALPPRDLVAASSARPPARPSAEFPPNMDAPTPLATAAKASVSGGDIPVTLLPDVSRLFADADDSSASARPTNSTQVSQSVHESGYQPLTDARQFGAPEGSAAPTESHRIDGEIIPGTTFPPAARLATPKMDTNARLNADGPARLSPEVEARLFGHADESGSIVGPDRAPGSILFPILLLVVIIAATLLAMKLTGLWI